jgi:hypothetical protein
MPFSSPNEGSRGDNPHRGSDHSWPRSWPRSWPGATAPPRPAAIDPDAPVSIGRAPHVLACRPQGPTGAPPSPKHTLADLSLHRAATTAGATFDAEGPLPPIIDAIVGIVGWVWRHGLLPDMQPTLGSLSASLQTGAVALATRFAGCLGEGRGSGSYEGTCGEKTGQKSSTHGLLLPGWSHRRLSNDLHPPHAQLRAAL